MRYSAEEAAPSRAIACIVASGLLFSCLDTSAKYLVLSGMDALFVSWMRFLEHVVLALILFKAWRTPAMFRVVNLPAQVLRGAFLFGSTIFNFLALETLQLAQTMSIAFFAPMLITALAGPLLGEWAGWRRWLAIAAGFVGVLVITRPGFGTFELGHLFALGSMLSNSFYVIMTRRMGAKESAESMIFYSALAPVVLIAPTVPYTASMPADLFHWAILLSLGFYGGFGHWLLIRAYKLATTSALAPYPYMQMVWMIFLGFVVFDQFPNRWTLAGAAIIVASGLYIVHREHRLRLKNSTAPNAADEELAKKL
ncbi:DMT family transporter [Mesorhizobium sp. BAC0120]|nr:DMT family transporter [Mesorhizobium sp. BAC0120]MDW6024971.1 DMT family transporter [Mesorhizobium sp. BAC0120]